MSSDRDFNPFEAPRHHERPRRTYDPSARPTWWQWCATAAGSSAILNVVLLALGDRRPFRLPVGQLIAFACAVVLIVMAFQAGRRFRFRTAVVLMQLLNAITWLTMIATVYVVLPHTIGDDLRVRDLPIFLCIWLAGSIVLFPIVWISGLGRMSAAASGAGDPDSISDS